MTPESIRHYTRIPLSSRIRPSLAVILQALYCSQMREKLLCEESSAERKAGIGLHLTSLPGPYGIGELGKQAYAFIDSMREMRLGVWQFLPLGPTGFGNSPYQSMSTFAGNELLIDIDDLLTKRLLKSREVAALRHLSSDYVDYGALIPVKTKLLKTAANRFAANAGKRLTLGFEPFLKRNNCRWLHDYALYRILKSRHDDKAWPDWAAEYVHRDAAALKKLERDAAVEIEQIKIMQFLFFEQWRRLRGYAHASGVQLFGDMPIYVALDSSDAWANRDILRIDENGSPDRVGGVPPDYFSEDGQLWGNPLYDWDAHARQGFQWWIDRIRASTDVADIVRIDHFRGFEAYWSIPAGAETAKDGRWEPGPGDAIFDAMHSAIGALPIVAEDLGVITPEVQALRDRHHLPGMVVLQFSVSNEHFDLAAVPRHCVCYTGTHDNDTTLGWFRGSSDDKRTPDQIKTDQDAALRVSGGKADNISMDMIKAAFATAANLAIAPMQDYLGLGSEARTNTPGTSSNNWRWRFERQAMTNQLCNEIAEAVGESGRDACHAKL